MGKGVFLCARVELLNVDMMMRSSARQSFLSLFFLAAFFLMVVPVADAGSVLEEVRAKAGVVTDGEKPWKVREQSWKGVFEPGRGRAIRVQLFRGKDYRFVFGTEGADGVHILGLMDRENRVVARTKPGKAGAISVMEFSPKGTGTYLVLLRADGIAKKRAGVMIYAYR